MPTVTIDKEWVLYLVPMYELSAEKALLVQGRREARFPLL